MNTVMKFIIFLRASLSLKHRLLGANSNYLLLHCNVRWLSKGRVLAGVWAIRNEIKMFLEQQKNHKARQIAQFLEDERKKYFMAFLSWHNRTHKWPQLKTAGQDQLCLWFGSSCPVFPAEVGDFQSGSPRELYTFSHGSGSTHLDDVWLHI